jgi:hypothetical protein
MTVIPRQHSVWPPADDPDKEPGLLQKLLLGPGSHIALAILCSKAMIPLKLPVALALTPYVHRQVQAQQLRHHYHHATLYIIIIMIIMIIIIMIIIMMMIISSSGSSSGGSSGSRQLELLRSPLLNGPLGIQLTSFTRCP